MNAFQSRGQSSAFSRQDAGQGRFHLL